MACIEVAYKPSFIRMYKKLSPELQKEVRDKITLLQNGGAEKCLKVHPLKGKLNGLHAFSVNFAYRIVFEKTKNELVLLWVGDHDVYKI